MSIRRERPGTDSAASAPSMRRRVAPPRKGLDFDHAFGRFEKVLRRVASRSIQCNGCRSSQTTALLHDAWMKLDAKRESIVDEKHLVALATRILGHLAVDQHRASIRRRTRHEVVSKSGRIEPKAPEGGDTFRVVERLFSEIADHSPRAATVAKLKLLQGLSIQEIATTLEMSERTICYDWKFARAMLASELRSQ
ncbi:MAG: hypothetical protein CMJ23_13735 [Phycisphaerae bacterium]|nr:hypothetical protein [Phycisphaerae bacterium]